MSQTAGQFTHQFTSLATGQTVSPEIPDAAAAAPRASAPPRREGYLSARDITRRYGRFTALDRVSFSVARGEFVCVLGPSGCGKTTVLRTVAGLERQDAGSVSIGGRDVSDLPTARRNVGIVFQSYALFPNLTAAQNVAYGLRNQGMPRPDVARRVDELLALVGLDGMQGKYPAQLSGGQQQRVALARAMALSPDILLLDEPLSALDAQVRLHLRGEIKDLQERLGVTTIMVTHDQEEALTMADRILVMDRGRIVQEGAPRQVYDHPATPFVAAFIGSMNFLPGAVKRGDGAFELAGRVLGAAREPSPLDAGAPALLAIRPEHVVLAREDESAVRLSAQFTAGVRAVEFRGASTRVSLALTGFGDQGAVEADLPASRAAELGLSRGQTLGLSFPAERLSAYHPA